MSIVIVGAGLTGTYLAQTLSREGQSVLLVEKNVKLVEEHEENIDVAGIGASGTNWKVLEDLLERKPFLLIAMTGSDETNLVASLIAKNLGYPTTVARVRNPYFLDGTKIDYQSLFLTDHIIAPDMLVAGDLMKQVLYPASYSAATFSHGMIQMLTVKAESFQSDATALFHHLHLMDEVEIGIVFRNEKIFSPDEIEKFHPQDEITFIGEIKALNKLADHLSVKKKSVKNITVLGGTDISLHLARLLKELGISLKIVEGSKKRCHFLADELPHATILNHSSVDKQFLIDEHIQNADLVIAAEHSQERNILISSLAKDLGAEQVVALISDANFSPLLNHMGITSILSANLSIANKIDSIIHAESLLAIESLYHNQAKVMELKIPRNSKVIGIPIKELTRIFPKKTRLALIESRGRIMSATDERILGPGDTALLFTANENVLKIKELFKP